MDDCGLAHAERLSGKASSGRPALITDLAGCSSFVLGAGDGLSPTLNAPRSRSRGLLAQALVRLRP